ncbi:hypothetical protein CC2G_009673 [Coprinopsis cinerea AmutBmut pab1-1]|nr:hypothetical protein CC2G_009673 [Coprinopsis cinerea AmutBmut pab1-1]
MDAVFQALSSYGDDKILEKLTRYILFSRYCRDEIILAQPPTSLPNEVPQDLPPSVVQFLIKSCGMSEEEVEQCWEHMGAMIWELPVLDDDEIRRTFLTHGVENGFPFQKALWPPSQMCLNPGCNRTSKGRKMQVAEQRKVILYTLSHGPVPTWCVHLKCLDCKTTYFHDYSVQNQERRYYDQLPNALQVADHHFVEYRLVQMWKANMNLAWMSASNCAATYKQMFTNEITSNFPKEWGFEVSLSGRHVYDAFTLSSLLEFYQLHEKTALVVPHDGEQANRFDSAVRQRNQQIRDFGQPALGHACSKCVRLYPATDTRAGYQVSAVVMDGITIGRPRCREPHCPIPLANIRNDKYCPEHADKGATCVVKGCKTKAEKGFRTCADARHRHTEELHRLRTAEANFPNKGRKERSRMAKENSKAASVDVGTPGEDRDVDGDEDGSEDGVSDDEITVEFVDGQAFEATIKPPTQAQQAEATVGQQTTDVQDTPLPEDILQAQFGRAWTHNEQILVCPCGIILARETFLFAESMPACADFIERTFKQHPFPDHIIFDNNCNLAKHVKDRDAFKNTGLAVDVFHFKCKHSKTDTFCQEHCNPHLFPELRGEGGKEWYFNTSIAEQTNAWLGGFQSICREMTPERYDFFLDEMILMRNRYMMQKLKRNPNVIIYS